MGVKSVPPGHLSSPPSPIAAKTTEGRVQPGLNAGRYALHENLVVICCAFIRLS
jgi:hypothetical protein